MGRLIDADEAYNVLTGNYHHRTETQHEALKEALSKVPTVDAVEVVRCRDCEWWNGYEESCFGKLARADDFCSWGERREDDTVRTV